MQLLQAFGEEVLRKSGFILQAKARESIRCSKNERFNRNFKILCTAEERGEYRSVGSDRASKGAGNGRDYCT